MLDRILECMAQRSFSFIKHRLHQRGAECITGLRRRQLVITAAADAILHSAAEFNWATWSSWQQPIVGCCHDDHVARLNSAEQFVFFAKIWFCAFSQINDSSLRIRPRDYPASTGKLHGHRGANKLNFTRNGINLFIYLLLCTMLIVILKCDQITQEFR